MHAARLDILGFSVVFRHALARAAMRAGVLRIAANMAGPALAGGGNDDTSPSTTTGAPAKTGKPATRAMWRAVNQEGACAQKPRALRKKNKTLERQRKALKRKLK